MAWIWPSLFSLLIVPFAVLGLMSLIVRGATSRISREYPALQTAPDADWRPCQTASIGASRLSGGLMQAVADAYALHVRPSPMAEMLGGRAFSVPWESVREGPRTRSTRRGVLSTMVLANGQTISVPESCVPTSSM